MNNSLKGLLGLLVIIFLLAVLSCLESGHAAYNDQAKGQLFIQIDGDVACPGIYPFKKSPSIGALAEKAGLLIESPRMPDGHSLNISNGLRIVFRNSGGELLIESGKMSSFYRLTLGIPVSINSETIESLTAVPGVGYSLAEAIVKAREENGGFKSLEDLKGVKGIGDNLFKRIEPYIDL